MKNQESLRGRGASVNPANRFDRIEIERDADFNEEGSSPKTQFFADSSRSVISMNDSPDVPFSAGLNPYRGCEHGCAYCYARPFHEYLGFSAGLDFESRIIVKKDAPELLRKELSSPRWRPQTLSLSGVTDPYQPVERKLEITRRCLEVLNEFKNPVSVISKNRLIARDADVLSELARAQAATACLSITTLDARLARLLEPRASTPEKRLEAVRILSQAGVPVGVNVAPVIPGLNDHEIPAILQAAAKAGARHAGYILAHLPGAVAAVFEDWLLRHFPERKDKVLGQIRALHGGQLQDPRFGRRMSGEGTLAEEISSLFTLSRRRSGLDAPWPQLSAAAFQRPQDRLGLFEWGNIA